MSDDTNEPNVLDKSRLPQRGNYAIGQALPLLIFTLCTIGFGSIFAVRNFMRFGGSAAVLDATAAVCAGQPGSQGAAYNPAVSAVHPVVVFRDLPDGRLVTDSAAVPEEWQAQDPADIELVLCIQFDRIAYRTLCNDNGGDSGLTVELGRELVVELRQADTGALVVDGLINSMADVPPPDVCLTEDLSTTSSEELVGPEQIQTWLRPFVIP